MNDRLPRMRPGGALGVLLIAGVLLVSATAGFLAQRLAAPARATLYPVSAPRSGTPARASAESANAAAAGDSAAVTSPRKIPERVPDIALPGPDGVPHRLTEWTGKPLLINFWATWCEPCRREIPLLKSLRHERASDGLQVVGVAVDFLEAARQYAAGHGIDYPLLIGEQGGLAAVSAFGMDTVLPFSVFADRQGQILTLKVGELHRDEAEFILQRLRDVDTGRLSLAQAREQVSQGIRRLDSTRQAAGG